MCDVEQRAKEYQEFKSWPDFLESIDQNKSWDMVKLICDQAKALKELQERYDALVKENEWQPIETAPKDGSHILLTNGENIHTGYYVEDYYEDGEGVWFGSSYSYFVFGNDEKQPTHWKPLPTPPKKD